jgi:hypothetical protein
MGGYWTVCGSKNGRDGTPAAWHRALHRQRYFPSMGAKCCPLVKFPAASVYCLHKKTPDEQAVHYFQA